MPRLPGWDAGGPARPIPGKGAANLEDWSLCRVAPDRQQMWLEVGIGLIANSAPWITGLDRWPFKPENRVRFPAELLHVHECIS